MLEFGHAPLHTVVDAIHACLPSLQCTSLVLNERCCQAMGVLNLSTEASNSRAGNSPLEASPALGRPLQVRRWHSALCFTSGGQARHSITCHRCVNPCALHQQAVECPLRGTFKGCVLSREPAPLAALPGSYHCVNTAVLPLHFHTCQSW